MTMPAHITAEEIIIDDFNRGLAPQWTTKSFAGETHYTAAREDDQPCILATSSGTASGLYYPIDYDPREFPILTWKWKVQNTLAKGDAHSKAGDDYAARIYVIFPSFFFWKTKALNYIWANKLPKGTAISNAYTANAMMIAVESGPEMTGKWTYEMRNIYEDYIKYFGKEPPRVGAIAIMTDTDNTKEEAAACYGPIRIMNSD